MSPAVHLVRPSHHQPQRSRPACHTYAHWRMDHRVPALAAIPKSLTSLSAELLSNIFEQLQVSSPASLLAVRLTSPSFYTIATPILYREVTLSAALVHPGARRLRPKIFEHISRHTNHVVIRSDLDPDGMRQLLAGIRRLLTIRWICVGNQALPSQAVDVLQLRANGTSIHIEELPIGHGTSSDYSAVLPCEFITTIKATSRAPHLTSRPEQLKSVLLRCRRLTSFHYEDRGQGTNFSFRVGERLPPLTELSLKSYDWTHTPEVVARHWDFSHIRVLKLRSVPIQNFLASIRFSDLANLRVLEISDFSAHHSDLREEATRGLAVLLGEHVRALEDLSVACHTRIFETKALMPHRDSLRVLRLRDHVGFGNETRLCPTIPAQTMSGLAERLSNVHTLEVDLDSRVVDKSAFLESLSRFRHLHTAVLHVQTLLSILTAHDADQDLDRDEAIRTFRSLVRSKETSSPWRSITINVGGWRPTMVRRLAEGWRELNREGVFAERCFVLERTPAGAYTVYEKNAVETASPGATD